MTENLAGRGEGLAGLRELSEKATPGPWTLEILDGYSTGHITSPLHTYCGNTVERKDSITAQDSMTYYDGKFIVACVDYVRAALEAAAPPSTAPLNTQKLMNSDRLEEIRAQLYGTDDGITIDDAKWLLHAYEQLINRVPAATQEPAGSGATNAGTALADEILLRIARRYEKSSVNIYPDMPCLTPVEAVLRCAQEEGFVLTSVAPGSPRKVGEDGAQTFEQWWASIHKFSTDSDRLDHTVLVLSAPFAARREAAELAWQAARSRPSSVPVGEQKQE